MVERRRGLTPSTFQFQNGSIKRIQLLLIWNRHICFNSKMVRLKERIPGCGYEVLIGFNSKMVRLKVKDYGFNSEEELSFNSKMVRLKARYKHSGNHLLMCFNSKMVRLKEFTFTVVRSEERVSIPKWFD